MDMQNQVKLPAETELNMLMNGETAQVDITSGADHVDGFEDSNWADDHVEFRDKSNDIDITMEKPKPLIYKVSENPPFHWSFLFGFQQALVSIAQPLATAFIVSEVVCGGEDDGVTLQVLCATMFMSGFSTFCMSAFGVRLPIFQGPTGAYLLPLLALQSLDAWKCPRTFKAFDPETNASVVMADMGNGTSIPNREVALGKLSELAGSLLVAGGMHFLIGVSGLVGVIIRNIGPITIVPTIMLVALQLYPVLVKFCQPDWLVASCTTFIPMIFSLCLAKYKAPIPLWTRSKGFHILWYPVHQVLSILLSMIIGYTISAILTASGFYSSDPESRDFLARIDARTDIISESDWFILPYAGDFGSYSFSMAYFVCFAMATMVSVLDSIGDYAAVARVAMVSPPPPFAYNRGLVVEGLMASLCGLIGASNPTVSFGANIGAIGVTKVASLRVFKMSGLIYMTLAVFGKLGAFFVTIPYPVLGGTLFISMGIFTGLLLSHLQNIDLNSVRNLAIIGTTLMVGFVVPYWSVKNSNLIDTGSPQLDRIISMLLSNAAFVGGVFSAFLDNTIPGTIKERGLLAQMQDLNNTADIGDETTKYDYEDGPEVYRLPFLPDAFRRSLFARLVPIFDVKENNIRKH